MAVSLVYWEKQLVQKCVTETDDKRIIKTLKRNEFIQVSFTLIG